MTHLGSTSDSTPSPDLAWSIVTAAIEDYFDSSRPTDDQPDGCATTLYPSEMANWVLRRINEVGYAITSVSADE
jgi:hypothetical protein